MKDVNKLSYVSERDIDLLLLEELNVNRDFALWMYSLVTGDDPETVELEGAWHSISNAQLGESDLVAIYDDGLAILIENKINASPQPDESYLWTPTLYSQYPTTFSAFCHSHGHCGFGKLKPVFIKYQHDSVKIKSGFTGFNALLSLRRALCASGFSLWTGSVLRP